MIRPRLKTKSIAVIYTLHIIYALVTCIKSAALFYKQTRFNDNILKYFLITCR